MALTHYKMMDCTFPEVQEYLKNNKTIIIPYGLSEQHGRHLPLGTDVFTAEYVSLALAEKLDCLVAPTLNYTFSGGMFPGTINVKPNTLSNLIGEIIESLHLQGFRNFIIMPGHCGSESLLHLKESLRILKWLNPALSDAMMLLIKVSDFSKTRYQLFDDRDYHAANAETSLMLHLIGDRVRLEELATDEEEVAERLRQDPDSYQLRESFTELPQEVVQTSQRADIKVGVMGYPEKANKERGKQIFTECIEVGAEVLAQAIKDADEARKSGKRIIHDNGDHLKIRSV
ncbi:MAG: creatininase family protein [Lentisphaeria bacterium]|nr:creatininase family protein [Lentisphaeria bacterium]